jgi:hypothetical protein
MIAQTDRETKKPTDFTLREKTPGSATIKFVQRGLIDPNGLDFDPVKVLEELHDLVAATIVADRAHDAVSLYNKILSNHSARIVEEEPIFYSRYGKNNSSSGYNGVAHIDFNADSFGGKNIQRTELHVRSYQSYLDYYLSSKSGRAARDSKLLGDAWGDHNYKIVEALGREYLRPKRDTRLSVEIRTVSKKMVKKKKTKS